MPEEETAPSPPMAVEAAAAPAAALVEGAPPPALARALLCEEPWLQRQNLAQLALRKDAHEAPLAAYVHETALQVIDEGYADARLVESLAERRSVIVAFAKVGGLADALDEGTGALAALQRVLTTATAAIDAQGGKLRQYMVDDKGVVVIWTFGTRKGTYEDNAHRALTTAADVGDALRAAGHANTIGLTAGNVFCGLVGSPYRCEYSVMGPSVNPAARLMCACEKKGPDVFLLCNDELRAEYESKGLKTPPTAPPPLSSPRSPS